MIIFITLFVSFCIIELIVLNKAFLYLEKIEKEILTCAFIRDYTVIVKKKWKGDNKQ